MGIGRQSSKWIRLGADETLPVADFSTNGVPALGEMAEPRGATVAGRCSVFAKSDMIYR
jgi:hypothetical protein